LVDIEALKNIFIMVQRILILTFLLLSVAQSSEDVKRLQDLEELVKQIKAENTILKEQFKVL
jgi:hypothetical protein